MKNLINIFLKISILSFLLISFLQIKPQIYASIPNPSLNLYDKSVFPNCTVYSNNWISCGSINYQDCPNKANYWVTCYADAAGALSSCSVSNPYDDHGPDATCTTPTPTVPCTGSNYRCGGSGAGSTICDGQASPGDKTGTDNTSCGAGMYCWYCPPVSSATPTPSNTPTPTRTPTPVPPPPGATATPVPPPTNTPPPGATATPRPTATSTPPPNATNTPTPVPACNSDCSQNANICQQAGGGCTYCNPTSKKCEQPPACNTDCSANGDICKQASGGCTYCNPTNKKCEVQPTATPTPPPYDDSMCTCDGLDYTSLSLGNPTTITAYGKVLGVNKDYAKIPSFTFRFFKGTDPKDQSLVKEEKINTGAPIELADKVQYKAVWNLTIPSDLDTKSTYRIQAKPMCSRKAIAAYFSPRNSVVLAAETQNLSILDRFVAFFTGLFQGSRPKSGSSTPAATPTLTNTQRKNLQLQTFRPVTRVEKGKDVDNCTFIKFNF